MRHAAVLRAYDARLQLACRHLGVEEHLGPLEGIDRELERLRVEYVVAGLDVDNPGALVTLERAALDVEVLPGPPEDAPPSPGRLAGSAIRLLTVVLVFVPRPHRDRYREEFTGELLDLAETGAGRARQLMYAARLIGHAWSLRRQLRDND
ncbi:hypothetical protein ACQP2F_20795 [Actinoplanes sp. CA-030573]|uniref:hypothetical protein n=1 Tax=Actinoplanes sp. CA-030573 TaxID=3239898 RepID=UPI003D8D79E0